MTKRYRHLESRVPVRGREISQRVQVAREDAIMLYLYGRRG